MNNAVDYAALALGLAVVALVLAFVLFVLLVRERTLRLRTATPLLGFIIVMLCVGSVLGAWGRVFDGAVTPLADYWIRVLIVSTRIAVVGAMLYDIRWLWRHRVDGEV